MPKAKILIVFGTRPEAIKLAPVIELLRADERFSVTVVSTGQHREMLSQVTDLFGFKPDIDLGLMHRKQPLNRILSRSLKGLDPILKSVKPDAVIVQGDTSTAAAAALAAFNRQSKVVHLEAGLRSHNLDSPFPEEANRKIISAISSLHLAPTANARDNLIAEGIDPDIVAVTGNTVIDALYRVSSTEPSFVNDSIAEALERFPRRIIFTSHRRENLASLRAFGSAISELSALFPESAFFLPLHLNPKIRKRLLPELTDIENVITIPPLAYNEFVGLMRVSDLIVTDSGGVQEEAPALNIPALLIRDTTERPEAIEAGAVRMISPSAHTIVKEVCHLLNDDSAYSQMKQAKNPFGDGRAADRVIDAIATALGIQDQRQIDEFSYLP
ncbi:non-hydrolyzing UDP-N-acetylglucosamine 2-epimerase [Corynebacterium sp. HMSC055D05]|uniref:non-hydrolyzing UDP-N-acetylglucosamine 2-epimerase n=1 Tax=Corynebacterium sp. HMSC055D05 TaxID=1715213 RepID=UPI0008A4966B|nr:UDP-N-acetylglucosamine 2-epimerase (non-hydrolyzing) [Corynebacterium sp. HMSC055D05]OFL94423.1 UDP-N-acetyl glucosamine 2-epimerase [Corynebacterium sp. HMSC055D05]